MPEIGLSLKEADAEAGISLDAWVAVSLTETDSEISLGVATEVTLKEAETEILLDAKAGMSLSEAAAEIILGEIEMGISLDGSVRLSLDDDCEVSSVVIVARVLDCGRDAGVQIPKGV